MRVLWFSITPSLYDEKMCGGWVASLEDAIRKYSTDIDLGIAFEHKDNSFKVERDGVVYYPIHKDRNIYDKIRLKIQSSYDWKLLKPYMLDIINDFKPDIIQCFGSECPFALIAKDISVPVVVHMQGFVNIYDMSSSMCCRVTDYYKFYHYNPFSILHFWYRNTKRNSANQREKILMSCNKYFLGRTDWDENIVKNFSPNANYYHCEEALRSDIMDCGLKWSFKKSSQMRLVTISSASSLKGNNLILQTAKILTEFGFDFEWRVAGNVDSFKLFESILGLKHEDYSIKLLGMIDANNVAKELASAEVYVHTAIIDNSPNSLCEAQIIGCPVVSSFVGGIPSLVMNGKTGLFYPFNEPHTLAFLLMNLHNDEDRLSFLSKNERNVAMERHNKQKIINNLCNIYKQIVK